MVNQPLNKIKRLSKRKEIAKEQAIPFGGIDLRLRSLRLFGRLSKNPAAVNGIIDDFTYGRGVWVYVHAIAGPQMTQNSFRRDFSRDPDKFRITPCLNMIYPENPLIQRQVSIKSHDYFFSSKNRPCGQFKCKF